MLSKNQIKLITSLQQKKYRNKYGLFVAEGVKVINELLNSTFELESLFFTEEFDLASNFDKGILISEKELKKISTLKTPNKVLGIFKIPEEKKIEPKGLIVALDGVNDPGNLGTIIRLCDWFGVSQLVCSTNTVDCFNAKVVQSTMGSLTRINISYVDIVEFLKETDLPIYGAVMNGENVHMKALNKNSILVMGNEANGITENIESLLTEKLTIPKFGLQKTESLNVATATAIFLNEFRRA